MDYSIHTNIAHGPLEIVDVGRIADDCREHWWNQTLCRVNDSVLRVGVLKGEFHWHRHDREDELFCVLEGALLVDLEERSVEIRPRQAFVVPRGVLHRTRAPRRTVVLMIEAVTVVPTGD